MQGVTAWLKAFHVPLVIDKGKDIFIIAGVALRAFEKRGSKNDVKILPLCCPCLFDRVDRVGQNHQQVSSAERIGAPPQGGAKGSTVTIYQLKALVPMQRESWNPLWNTAMVDAVREGRASVYFCFMQVRMLHRQPPKIGLC